MDKSQIISEYMREIGSRTSERKAESSKRNGQNAAERLRGRVVSPETRAKMAEAQARRWAAKKNSVILPQPIDKG